MRKTRLDTSVKEYYSFIMPKPSGHIVEVLESPVGPNHMRQIWGLVGELTTREVELDEVRQNVGNILDNPEQQLIIAKQAGRIIGMATITRKIIPSERTAVIDDVVVSAKHKSGGIARAMMTYFTETADREGLTLQLTNQQKRHEARLLYESLGFHIKPTDYFTRRPRG
jgi:GNAT superfamily N-acetyltransferase